MSGTRLVIHHIDHCLNSLTGSERQLFSKGFNHFLAGKVARHARYVYRQEGQKQNRANYF